jgi:Fic family protein
VEPPYAGLYRDVNVVVADHSAPSHQLVPSMMDEFSQWLLSEQFASLHPIERAALAHFQLVCILW